MIHNDNDTNVFNSCLNFLSALLIIIDIAKYGISFFEKVYDFVEIVKNPEKGRLVVVTPPLCDEFNICVHGIHYFAYKLCKSNLHGSGCYLNALKKPSDALKEKTLQLRFMLERVDKLLNYEYEFKSRESIDMGKIEEIHAFGTTHDSKRVEQAIKIESSELRNRFGRLKEKIGNYLNAVHEKTTNSMNGTLVFSI